MRRGGGLGGRGGERVEGGGVGGGGGGGGGGVGEAGGVGGGGRGGGGIGRAEADGGRWGGAPAAGLQKRLGAGRPERREPEEAAPAGQSVDRRREEGRGRDGVQGRQRPGEAGLAGSGGAEAPR